MARQAVDAHIGKAHHCGVTSREFRLGKESRCVVGSVGDATSLAGISHRCAAEACDVVELRLDLLGEISGRPWEHLRGLPLLFTARRGDEGGAGGLDAAARGALLEAALDDAACVDIEVASLGEMDRWIGMLAERGIPWIASFHDFARLPSGEVLAEAAAKARGAGAAVFKVAARLHDPGDLARLADFQLADHGLPVASMGMGPLAAVSRLLCAQCGSVLNYGFLGTTATAPGQWDAEFLKKCISRTVPAAGK